MADMKTCTAVVARDADAGLYVGWVPGVPGAHSQGETLDELQGNLREVIELLIEDGEMRTESEFAEHLATKTDLAALETRLIKWMAGIALSAATVAIATAAALIITVIRTLAGQ